MDRSKREKGITLVALIITIIVLLILAVVAIRVVNNTDIIEYGQNAKEKYEVEKIEEKIKLIQSEIKLRKNGNEIKVRDILEEYGEKSTDLISIKSNAKSIPENMPAGEYYVLTPEKYAHNNVSEYAKLTSRGEAREKNILKDVYVINEQFDIYYIIEANLTLQEDVEIDYDAIAQILNKNMNEEITYEEMVEQLKQIQNIDNENIIELFDFMVTIFLEDNAYFYFWEIDALYRLDPNTNNFIYLREIMNETPYNYGRNIKAIKSELERIFVNKTITVSEIREKYKLETLDEYVLKSSNNIIDIVFGSFNETELRVESITFKDGDNEITISEDDNNYSNWIYCNEEVFYKVEISLGT